MSLPVLLVVVFTLSVYRTAFAQIETVRPDASLNEEHPELPHVEPHVAADPADPRQLLVGSIVTSPRRDGHWSCAVFLTRDGGSSWRRHDFEMRRCIDPWVLFLNDGSAIFTGIEIRDDAAGDGRFRLVISRSEDGGVTWVDPPDSLGRGYDHELLVPAPAGVGSGSPSVFLTARGMRRTAGGHPRHGVFVARSDDGGRGFVELAEIQPSNLALNPTGIAFLPDRTLVVSFWDFQRNVDGFERGGMLQLGRAWLVRSGDAGRTFSEPLFVTDDCASGIEGGFPGYPSLAVDASGGPLARRMYHACVRPGFDGISVTRSSDGGETWSEGVVVGDPRGGVEGEVRTPMLAMNRQGVVALAWYDRRPGPDGVCQDLLFSASTDGGVSFADPVRVSDETSCPATPGNGRASRAWPMGGDYGSLVAAADGLFHVVWADSRSGVFQLRVATLRVPAP